MSHSVQGYCWLPVLVLWMFGHSAMPAVETRIPAGEIGESRSREDREDPRFAAAGLRLSNLILQQMEEKGIPAFSISLVVDQKVVFSRGFGTAQQAAGNRVRRAADGDTVYRVGSISKLFTDLAVMQLVEKGELDLDADVKNYLPDFNPRNPFGKPITLRQLMSHRSGLVREPPIGHYFDPNEPTVRETTRSLNRTQLIYAPESRTKYSNAGITVVGRVLEKVTGKHFESVIRESILEPLGMKRSSFRFDQMVKSDLAEAIMWTHDGRTFAAPRFKLGIAPAGNLYSSVNDLSRFMSAVFNEGKGQQGRILSSDLLRQMTEPQFAQNSFGIGFRLSRFQGHTSIGHGGAVYGYSTQWTALPEKKIGVIAAASKDITNGIVTRISQHGLKELLAVLDKEDPPVFEATGPVAESRIRPLVGQYTSNTDSIQIFRRNERAIIDLGEFRRKIRSDDQGLVCDDELGFGPRIELAEGGLRVGQKMYQRLESKRPAPLKPGWENLVGEYGWDHNTLYVYEKRGQLWCTIEWFFQYPLKQVDEKTFAFPDHGLYHGEQLIFDTSKGAARAVEAAKINFVRREVGTRNGETFKIEPIKSIEDIRRTALTAEPPVEKGEFRKPDLVEIVKLDSSIKLDIRYASDNNFMGSTFYSRPAAFLQRPAAEALVRVHRKLKARGYGLLIHDAYRPWFVTKMFWEATPGDMKIFVANPANGSRHNRGCAVDLTLYALESGRPIWMGAGYDEFSSRSFPDYAVDSSSARWHRELLRSSMESEGFRIYEFEWWHFDYKDWKSYPILNRRFD